MKYFLFFFILSLIPTFAFAGSRNRYSYYFTYESYRQPNVIYYSPIVTYKYTPIILKSEVKIIRQSPIYINVEPTKIYYYGYTYPVYIIR